jgi:hypothetical protein
MSFAQGRRRVNIGVHGIARIFRGDGGASTLVAEEEEMAMALQGGG